MPFEEEEMEAVAMQLWSGQNLFLKIKIIKTKIILKSEEIKSILLTLRT